MKIYKDGTLKHIGSVEYYRNYEKEKIKLFRKYSDQKLIDSFNSQIKNSGWCTAKMIYLYCLKKEIIKRFDTSNFAQLFAPFINSLYMFLFTFLKTLHI